MSGIGVENLWGSPLLASDLKTVNVSLSVSDIVLNTVVLAVLGMWYWKYSVVLSGNKSLCLSLDESQGLKAVPALSR